MNTIKIESPGLKFLAIVLLGYILSWNLDFLWLKSYHLHLVILSVLLICYALRFKYSNIVFSVIAVFAISIFLQIDFSVLLEYQWIDEFNGVVKQGQHWIKSKFRDGKLSNQTVGLLENLILADRSNLDKEINIIFKSIGGAHLLAVSGMHVGIIFLIVSSVFGLIKFVPNKLRYFLILFCLLVYGCFTNFTIPVIRALLMVSVFLIGKIFNERSDTLNTLFISAALNILFDSSCLESWSFQFSYLGVLGIILGQRYVFRSNHSNSYVRSFINLNLVSMYAQIMLFPLLLYYTGDFSTVFLLTSLILTPIIYLIIFCGILFIIFEGNILFVVLERLVESLIYVAEGIEQIPLALYHTDKFTFLLMLVFYLILGTYILYRYLRKRKLLILLSLEVYAFIFFSLSCRLL